MQDNGGALEIYRNFNPLLGAAGHYVGQQLVVLHVDHSTAHLHENNSAFRHEKRVSLGLEDEKPSGLFFRLQNALLSALPYLVMWIFSLLVAQMADLTARRNWASINVIRKTANTIGIFKIVPYQ